jgi:UDP-GlcNAc:undecaprenyl-phosphate GlcNAc-1-phosphate transferase
MGDAGSMFIGFSVVWMLIRSTQEVDIIAFKPDREHLHHICERRFYSYGEKLVTHAVVL